MDQILAMLSPMTLAWLAVLIVLIIAEAATVALVSIWFCGGALAALIASALGAPVWVQALLFLVVSVVLLALLRPFARKYARGGKVALNADRHIGQTALVTEEIDNLHDTGAVRLDGVVWTARSESGEVIPAGTVIEVRRRSGAKAWVIPARAEAEV